MKSKTRKYENILINNGKDIKEPCKYSTKYIIEQNGDIFIKRNAKIKGPYTFDNVPSIRYYNGEIRSLKTIPDPGKSLLDIRPDIADEIVSFEDERYSDLTGKDLCISSNTMTLFKCHKCGHMWRTTICSRTMKCTGCPHCAEDKH